MLVRGTSGSSKYPADAVGTMKRTWLRCLHFQLGFRAYARLLNRCTEWHTGSLPKPAILRIHAISAKHPTLV